MPELSRFYGIIIRMFVETGSSHHHPHFHAYYQGEQAVFSIDPIGRIEGTIPARQQRLIEAWAEIHQFQLIDDWDLLQQGLTPSKIEPLK
jgi:hypothetical protein